MNKKAILIVLIVLVAVLFSFIMTPILDQTLSERYHTTLLTVSEADEWVGGTADLYLEIKPGKGRIFIDSFPLSKLDTQFSTRYANELACDFLDANCDRYDFFYTIRADSSVVGGPSAGAAITILTIAALDGQPIKQDVAMTGTINSGLLIGPVAGVVPKAKAARSAGIMTVLVPALSALGADATQVNFSNNETVNYSQEYDDEIIAELSIGGFELVQASDLYDALPYFIDKEYPEPEDDFVVESSYSDIMQRVAFTLCERRAALEAQVADIIEANKTYKNRSEEIHANIERTDSEGLYYAKASYCFSHSIDVQEILLKDVDDAELKEKLNEAKRAIVVVDASLKQEPLTTIGDVETYAIVRERLIEAQELIDGLGENISRENLAYAIERVHSAEIWATFFGLESSPYVINERFLKEACANKIAEADERVSYVEAYLPLVLTEAGREELRLARSDSRNGEYALCLFKASKAKAEASILSSALAVTQTRLEALVDTKLHAVERVLRQQAAHDLFPIMGYSYYEYAQSLKEDQAYSALTFAEYALELSNLHIYFPEQEPWWHDVTTLLDPSIFLTFLIGFLSGSLVFYLVFKD